MRKRLQKSALVAAACLGAALPGAVAAQIATVPGELLDTLLRACPSMLTKPQDCATRQGILGSDGKRDLPQVSGENVVEFDTTTRSSCSGGLVDALGKYRPIGISYGAFPTARILTELESTATQPVFRRNMSALDASDMLGGAVEKGGPDRITSSPREKVDNNYQYWITGLAPGAGAVANAYTGEGNSSYHMHDHLVGKEYG